MTRFCDKMPCERCHELLFELFVSMSIFGLAIVAKVMPLIAN
ncbi:MAG: hypothetical protein ACLPWS_15735 [Rhodomicrobium sp.]